MGAALGKQTTPGKTHERMKICRRTDGSTASTRPALQVDIVDPQSMVGSTLSTRGSTLSTSGSGHSGLNGSTVSTRGCGRVDCVDQLADIIDPCVGAGRHANDCKCCGCYS